MAKLDIIATSYHMAGNNNKNKIWWNNLLATTIYKNMMRLIWQNVLAVKIYVWYMENEYRQIIIQPSLY